MNPSPPDFWSGEKVQRCALGVEDFLAAEAGTLPSDSEAERFEDSIYFPSSRIQHRALLEQLATREGKGDMFFWVIRDVQGKRVGHINTFDCDSRVGAFKYAVAIAREYRRRGYAREAIGIVLRYYVHELRWSEGDGYRLRVQRSLRAASGELGSRAAGGWSTRTVSTTTNAISALSGKRKTQAIWCHRSGGVLAERAADSIKRRSAPWRQALRPDLAAG